MKATYIKRGRGKSLNAYACERNGMYPLTTAVKVISAAIKPYYKVSQKTIRFWLEMMGPSEWHHVGKYANECNYYDASAVIDALLFEQEETLFWDYIELIAESDFEKNNTFYNISPSGELAMKVGHKPEFKRVFDVASEALIYVHAYYPHARKRV